MSTEKTLSELLDEYRSAIEERERCFRRWGVIPENVAAKEQHARRAIEEEYGKR